MIGKNDEMATKPKWAYGNGLRIKMEINGDKFIIKQDLYLLQVQGDVHGGQL